jgi:hypothetical protein
MHTVQPQVQILAVQHVQLITPPIQAALVNPQHFLTALWFIQAATIRVKYAQPLTFKTHLEHASN